MKSVHIFGLIVGASFCAGAALLHSPVAIAQAQESTSQKTLPPSDVARILENARNIVSFSAIGPVHIEAEVKAILANGKKETGTYTLDWAAPDRFREEIHFKNGSAIKVASGDTLYIKRYENYMVLVLCTEEMMNPADLVSSFTRDEARQASAAASASSNAVPADPPVQEVNANDHDRMLFAGSREGAIWVDQKHGWPASVLLHKTADQESIDYVRYQPEGSGFIAFQRQYFVSGRAIMEVDIKRVTRAPNFLPRTFDPPTDSEKFAWCSDEIPARPVPFKGPLPVSSDDFASPGLLDAFVRADGTPSRLKILETAGPQENAAIQKLADLIRFTPATCGGKALESETTLVIDAMTIAAAGVDLSNIPSAGQKGYTTPTCIYCPNPQYSDEAFHAKIQGQIVMNVVIGTDGRAHNINIIKGLGHGLDEEAIRAARDVWRFKPANGPTANLLQSACSSKLIFISTEAIS